MKRAPITRFNGRVVGAVAISEEIKIRAGDRHRLSKN